MAFAGPPQAGRGAAVPVASHDFFGQPANSMMVQAASNIVTTTIGNYLPFASILWRNLRLYFHVNNSYVVNKLRVLLFPFRHPRWNRLTAEEVGAGGHHDVGMPGSPQSASVGGAVALTLRHTSNPPTPTLPNSTTEPLN
jgi:hypothetical protein